MSIIYARAHRIGRALSSSGLGSHFILVLASVLVPLALFGIIAWQDRLSVVRNAQAEVERRADGARDNALNVLQNSRLLIILIDRRIQSMSWDEIAASREVHDYLAKLVKDNPEIDAAWLDDADGVVRNSSRIFPMPPTRAFREPDFFIAARARDGIVIGKRLDQPDSTYPDELGGPHFPIAQRRGSSDGRFDGVIVLKFDASSFAESWLNNWGDSPGQLTLMVDTNLDILAREPAVGGITRLDPNGFIATAVRSNASEGSYRRVSSLDGIDRIYAFRRVIPYDVYVAYGISMSALLRTWYGHLIVYGAIFGLAALGLAALSIMAAQRALGERLAMANLAAETEERREIEKQLLQAEKLDALGKMAGGFAHDFGNVLMAVQMNLDLLRGYTVGEGKAVLQRAIAEVERGSEAVRSLLIFARRGSLETQIVDPKAQIERLAGLLRQAAGKQSALEMLVENGLWSIEVNANQLELALLNLVINARDAMPDGGMLRVTARNVSLSGNPEGLAGKFLEISVSDTGHGMSPEVAAKAMEPFFTTKEAGTGLGLGQVYGFAKHCGGAVTLTSAVGLGTTVTMYIPQPAAFVDQDLTHLEPATGKSN